MNQKVKDKNWTDETGRIVPLDYISPGNRLKERSAASLLRDAKRINKQLKDFQLKPKELCDKCYDKMLEEFIKMIEDAHWMFQVATEVLMKNRKMEELILV